MSISGLIVLIIVYTWLVYRIGYQVGLEHFLKYGK